MILYHGVEKNRADDFIKHGRIPCMSTHLFKDGARVDYRGQSEQVMVGICTSLDIDIAKRFGEVIFVIDTDLLDESYKLFRVNYFTNPEKDEKEVFIAAYISKIPLTNYKRLNLAANNRFEISTKCVIDIISQYPLSI